MITAQREKEERMYNDYLALMATGMKASKAVQTLMLKYSYGYEASVWTVIRRCKQRKEKEGNYNG